MSDRSIGRTVWNLVLALLNATLILVAICLWFAWSAAASVERVADQIITTAKTVQPIRGDIRSLSIELQDIRTELARLPSQQGGQSTAIADLTVTLSELQGEIAQLSATMDGINIDTDALVDRAVQATFNELGQVIARVVPRLETSDDGAGSE